MALNEKIKVEIPKHCVKVPTGKYTYIHLVLRAYRNEKGQPTNERVSIGRLDEESGMLIPNKRYYEIFGEPEKETQPTAVKSIGLHAAFRMAASECGLEKLTRSIFGERADALLTVAEYMLSDGNVMSYMEDWQEEQVGYLKTPLTGQGLSRLFSSITREERMAFFEEWMRMHRTDEYLAYDVMSVSSYSQGIESLEWGYNRDREALPQINLGMYYGEESRLPLYYRIYPGSIPDKAHLKTMVENGPGKKIRFVMDRGFCTKENLSWLTEQGHRFVIAIPGGLKYAQELIRLHRDEIVNRSSCRLGDDLPYGKAYESTEYGFRMMVHIYYDPQKAVQDSENLYREIARQEAELSEMTSPPDRKLRYDRYFFINRSKDGGLGYRRNADAIDEALSRCGFFLIAETDFRKNSREILEIYRERDVVEKSFDNLKNELDMRRLFVHSEKTAEGKTFAAFLALIVRSVMQNAYREVSEKRRLSFRKILFELGRIKVISSAASGNRLLNPLSRSQRDLLSQLSSNPVGNVCYLLEGI
jgi:hypothetical protein